MGRVLSSRRFWTAVLDAFVSLALYFSAKYLAPATADDVKIVIATLQPLFAIVIIAFSIDDVNERQTAERLEQARIRQQYPTLDPVPTETTARAQSLWEQYPPVGPTGHVSGIPDHDTNEADRARART